MKTKTITVVEAQEPGDRVLFSQLECGAAFLFAGEICIKVWGYSYLMCEDSVWRYCIAKTGSWSVRPLEAELHIKGTRFYDPFTYVQGEKP